MSSSKAGGAVHSARITSSRASRLSAISRLAVVRASASVGSVSSCSLGQRQQLGGLGAAGLLHAAAPEGSEHRGHHNGEGECRRGCDPPSPASAGRERGHRRGEGLLKLGQAARVALPPDRILPVRRAGPEQVVRPVVLVPGPRRLAELVAQQGALGVLRLPADEAGPGGEQRLVDDLDGAVGSPSSPATS